MTGLSLPTIFLWTNVLPDDGSSEQPKHIAVSYKTNMQDLHVYMLVFVGY
jgi:hypothetical protein